MEYWDDCVYDWIGEDVEESGRGLFYLPLYLLACFATAVTQIRIPVRTRGICGGQIGTGAGVPLIYHAGLVQWAHGFRNKYCLHVSLGGLGATAEHSVLGSAV
jgi:hypothetical protein